MSHLQESKDRFNNFTPILPILDTEEILEKIGSEWKIPEPFGFHKSSYGGFASHDREQFREFCDMIFLQWVNFLDNAANGRQIAVDTIQKGEIGIDLVAIESYLMLNRAVGNDSNPENTSLIRTAFAMLLSPGARQEAGDEVKPVRVNNKLKEKINKLVRGMALEFGMRIKDPLKV